MQRAKGPALIGLTGVYCAGKNHVAALLEQRGFEVLDVDKLGHRAIECEKERITARFGPGILGPDGKVDRQLLGREVFGRPEELAALEGIVHPVVQEMTAAWINEKAGKPLVINAALLHRSAAFTKLDCVILVKAPFLVRLLRARKRDGLPLKELFTRFKSQKHFISQYLSRKSDIHIVENRGYCTFFARFNQKQLERRIDRLLLLLEKR
ncbi:MAG: dephospho-CoA kinase [Spirochaetaceae bacterium]|jgi:dephospho-CoA kinase|nr:dephospho-CoA kinase [Spirochaetaceae bacterium]